MFHKNSRTTLCYFMSIFTLEKVLLHCLIILFSDKRRKTWQSKCVWHCSTVPRTRNDEINYSTPVIFLFFEEEKTCSLLCWLIQMMRKANISGWIIFLDHALPLVILNRKKAESTITYQTTEHDSQQKRIINGFFSRLAFRFSAPSLIGKNYCTLRKV